MFKSIDPFFTNRIINHSVFWIVMVILSAYHGSLFGGGFQENLINMVVLLPIQMLVAYALVYWQTPKWFFRAQWLKFFLSLLVVGYVSSVIGRWLMIYVAEPLNGIDGIDESLWEIVTDPIYLIKVYTVTVYLPSIFLFLVKMTKERFVHEARVATLMEEKRKSELNFLKAQMNPHFLFNTLNNIYSLAQRKAEQTPEMIMKLSEILDYTIYECNAERVAFIREWELIENYADLQALRYNEEVDLVLHKEMDDESVMIAPLILIAIVENAFKYGLQRISSAPRIRISSRVENGVLYFKVENNKEASMKEVDKRTSKDVLSQKGIGVNSVRRQLSLQYPEKHTLNIEESTDLYTVNLTMQL